MLTYPYFLAFFDGGYVFSEFFAIFGKRPLKPQKDEDLNSGISLKLTDFQRH